MKKEMSYPSTFLLSVLIKFLHVSCVQFIRHEYILYTEFIGENRRQTLLEDGETWWDVRYLCYFCIDRVSGKLFPTDFK